MLLPGSASELQACCPEVTSSFPQHHTQASMASHLYYNSLVTWPPGCFCKLSALDALLLPVPVGLGLQRASQHSAHWPTEPARPSPCPKLVSLPLLPAAL